jgi:hypothetical protein
MRLKPFHFALVAILVIPAVTLGQWQEIAPGISYRQMDLPGPVKAYIARGDSHKDSWTIDSMTSKGTIKGGFETVPDMARRYDDTITWDGRRYELRVAINGDFYSPTTGYALGGQVMNGWYAKRYGDDGGMSGFFWTSDRKCFIGGDVHNGPKLQQVVFADKSRMNINAYNDKRGKDELALYTAQWDSTTGSASDGVEVLVRMDEPVAVNPPAPGNRGVVVRVAKDSGSMPIPFDCVVLSATGAAAPRLLQHVKVGAAIHFDMRLEDIGVERIRLKPAPWQRVWASIGDTQNLLMDGYISRHWEAKAAKLAAEGKKHGSVVKDPRTAIAFNKDYVFFIVVDGRSPRSVGMTYTDLAEFCLKELKADFAVNQDGGGSSTMWIDGEVKNIPSGKGKEEKQGVLRPVANGYLMALVHPAAHSRAFKAGAGVKAATQVELRLGPSTQYGSAGTVAAGDPGEILDHRLNGIQAKGGNWWLARFGTVEGWVPEKSLAR